MTTPQKFTRRSPHQRTAFTLVEMLMVIAIIGILAGILTPVLMSAFGQANEFKITNEIQQLNAAIENFKTDHGFYPPTIGSDANYGINNVADMRRYLNRIAPNHSEGNGGTGTLLRDWWDNVGSNLDERSSLVFWLSGLCKNKQFPLSGGTGSVLPAFDNNSAERDLRFEFINDRLIKSTVVAVYNQPAGRSSDDFAYRYLDNKSYGFGAYHNGVDMDPANSIPDGTPINFYNQETFQIVSPGMDGEIGGATVNLSPLATIDPAHVDNIANFTNGRIEKELE